MPAPLRKTLTYDRGNEMAEHERLAQRVAAPVLAQRHGLVTVYAARVERHRASVEYAPEKVPQLRHAAEVFTQLRHHSPVALGT